MSRPNVLSVGEALPSSQARAASHRYTEADMDAVIKPSPVPSSPTTKSPFRGMPDRSSGFKNRTPSKLGADGEAVNGGRNGFTAVEFRSEWEDELERRTYRLAAATPEERHQYTTRSALWLPQLLLGN